MADIKKTIFAVAVPLMAALPNNAKADTFRLSYTIGDSSRIHFAYSDPKPYREKVVIVKERPHVVKKVIIKERKNKGNQKVKIVTVRNYKDKHYKKKRYVSRHEHRRMHRRYESHVHRYHAGHSHKFRGGYVYLYE